MKTEKLENQVVFVQLKNRVVVHEIRTPAKYGDPEWKFAEKKSLEAAKIINDADIKFALSSDLSVFKIMVSEKDAEKAIELLKEKQNNHLKN
ncbi:MAG: hypothetical protein WCW04_00730 [Candidatus Paceibacterota bacterium]